MADKIDYYMEEKSKIKEKNTDPEYKHFNSIHTKEILDDLGLIRYCCRRNMISNIDMIDII